MTANFQAPNGLYGVVSEGISVSADERWRLFAGGPSPYATACGPSARIPDVVLAPMVLSRSRWVALARSRASGRGAIRSPTLSRSRVLRIAVRDADETPVVRVGSRSLPAHRSGPNRFAVRLPSRGGGRRLVVETRWGFWTARLRAAA
jgi:hypothetical protein